MRESYETNQIFQGNVNVTPIFRKHHTTEISTKLNYEQRLVLVCTESYIRAPNYVVMNSGGRDFQVFVDPSGLSPGFHYGEIQAFDSTSVEKGPVFKIPVSITKPSPIVDNRLKFESLYGPGVIDRHFINVPDGATWAELSIVANGPRSPGKFVAHLTQLLPHKKHTKTEQMWYLNLHGTDPIPSKTFAVTGGFTLELCTAQFWSSLGAFKVQVELVFHGIKLSPVHISNGFGQLECTASLGNEDFSPSITFGMITDNFRYIEKAFEAL